MALRDVGALSVIELKFSPGGPTATPLRTSAGPPPMPSVMPAGSPLTVRSMETRRPIVRPATVAAVVPLPEMTTWPGPIGVAPAPVATTVPPTVVFGASGALPSTCTTASKRGAPVGGGVNGPYAEV